MQSKRVFFAFFWSDLINAQELFIGASLDTIVSNVIRYYMTYETLPFGLIAMHLQFTQTSFLCSPEFWCSPKALFRSWKGLLITPIIILGGLVALAAGPSSAVLLVPSQTNDWNAGGSLYYIAGNDSANWPNILDRNAVGM